MRSPQVYLCLYRCVRTIQSGFIIGHKGMQEFWIASIMEYLSVCLYSILKGGIVLDADAIEVSCMIGRPIRLPRLSRVKSIPFCTLCKFSRFKLCPGNHPRQRIGC